MYGRLLLQERGGGITKIQTAPEPRESGAPPVGSGGRGHNLLLGPTSAEGA